MASPCEKFFGDGGIQNQILLQPFRASYAIQKMREMSEFRETWKKDTGMPYEETLQEPVRTWWEHMSLACC